MRTYQGRLHIPPGQVSLLNEYAERFQKALRSLHARHCAGMKSHKTAFMAEFAITGRQYNAVEVTLDGIYQAERRRHSLQEADLLERIRSTARRVRKTADLERRHQLRRRLDRLKQRLAHMQSDGSRRGNVCFGSRKLFRAQHALAANGFASHADWLSAWRTARSRQFFVLGSRGENGGCQGCVLTYLGENRFSVRLRLTNASPEKYVNFEVRFAYGPEHLAWALETGQAISYRFLRDGKGWRIFATTAIVPIAKISEIQRGALGVDLNADHVALSLTKYDGNLVFAGRIPLTTYGKTHEQAAALTGDAAKDIIGIAVRSRTPIAVEKLNFTKKKARLRQCTARYARMLSSFAYSRFVKTLCARAHDAGIAVVFTNPAYSSLIGRYKFAERYGISGHQSAALVLARRVQRFSERPNRRDQVTLRSPVRKRVRHVWSSWVEIARNEVRDGLYRRSHKRDPSAASAAGAITPPVAGEIPAREFVASTVRAASLVTVEDAPLRRSHDHVASLHSERHSSVGRGV